MADVEYRIGGLEFESCGKFVVEGRDNVVSFYALDYAERHFKVVEHFGLDESNIVGGGDIVLGYNEELILSRISGDYGGIPESAAQRFCELIVPELRERGIEIDKTEVDIPTKFKMYWHELGFR